MNRRNHGGDSKQKGTGMIMLLIIAALLLIAAATAFRISYSLHKQNQQAKIKLQERADSLKIQRK
jgi:flagellar basal body-associated protein FliL